MLHKRYPKNPHNWKHDIICTKRKSDFYIEGGTGYTTRERLPSGESTETINRESNETVALKAEEIKISSNKSLQDKPDVLHETEANSLETLQNAKEIYSDSSKNLHQLSRAVFLNEKEIKMETNGSPSLPINYSVHAGFSQAIRPTAESDENFVRYQSISDTFQPGNLLITNVQPVPDEARSEQQIPITTTENGLPQALPVQWQYAGYPYYNPATFQPYQGPNNS